MAPPLVARVRPFFFVFVGVVSACESPVVVVDPPVLQAPIAASSFVANPGVGQVQLTWNDNSSNETVFRIGRKELVGGVWTKWISLVNLGPNSVAHLDATVVPWRKYQYRLRVCEFTDCTAFVNSASVIPTAPAPSAPSDLMPVAGVDEVALTWTDGSDVETSFTLGRRARQGGVWQPWGVLTKPAADATSYTDESVSGGTSYQYRLRACNPTGCSAWATAPVVTTPANFAGEWEGTYSFGPMSAVFEQDGVVVQGQVTDALNCVYGGTGAVTGNTLLFAYEDLLVEASPACVGVTALLSGTLDATGSTITGNGVTTLPAGQGVVPWTFSMSR